MTNAEAVTALVEFATAHSVHLTRSRADRAIKGLREKAKAAGRELPLEVAVEHLRGQLVADDGVFAKDGTAKRVRKDDPTCNEVSARENRSAAWLKANQPGTLAPVTKQYGNPLHAEEEKAEA